ncbi:MAG: type I-B CRISPR-associated protein Cas5b [bacterium]|nr:type I-B CRISPR-associated protein Cas5b [bacterium]
MAVIFDCSSNIAMFRKPYTTTSSSSFVFPPPTAIAGIISAILGIDNESHVDGGSAAYWPELSGTSVAVKICNPVKWFRGTLNFWNVKNPQKSPHIQVKHQFLLEPKYRIYVRGPLEGKLLERLSNGDFIYTPYLGVAYAIADIDYQGSCDASPVEDDVETIDTIVPLSDGLAIDFVASKKIYKEIVPFAFNEKRALQRTMPVLYSDSVGKIVLKEMGGLDVTRCMGEVVAWFPEW